MKEIFQKITTYVPKHLIIPLIFGSMGIILFGYGLIQYFVSANSRENSNQPQNFTPSGIVSQKIPTITPSVKPIVVDVEGAVLTPGVYSLPVNSRIQDALIAAGGIGVNADRVFVAKQINLAAKLLDGGKIYIPKVGEQSVVSQTALQQTQTSILRESTTGLVHINTAGAADLVALKGIGSVTAQKIINGRPYTDTQELVDRKIVSKKVFDQIKDKITTE